MTEQIGYGLSKIMSFKEKILETHHCVRNTLQSNDYFGEANSKK